MDLDEILIEAVRNRPLIYDRGHKDYKNLRKKNYAWKKVSFQTNLSELECKKRWKTLRDSYKRCKRTEQVASGGSAETTRKKWKYFEAISFLDNVSNYRRTIGCVNDEGEYKEETKSLGILDGDSLSESSESESSSARRQKKKHKDKFRKFLDLASTCISQTSAAFASQIEKQNSTALHFSSLAAKIVETGLPPKIVNSIEAKVSELVFGEINKFYSTIVE